MPLEFNLTKGMEMKKLVLGTLLCLPLAAQAVTIDVTLNSCGSLPTPACDALLAELDSTVNQDLPDVDIDEYGTGIANANAFSYKGGGSDYSDHFDIFMARIGGGLAVQGDLDNAESADGIGFGAAVTAGLNLDLLPVDKIGPIDLSKMDLFVSFMSYKPEQDVNDSELEGELSHFAVMARYRLIDEKDFIPGSILKWGGVMLHTGLQRSTFAAKITQNFEDETVDIGSNQTATLGDTSATFDLDSTVTSIPIEVSTYLRAGYVFTLFGGAGFDLVSGSTDVSLDAGGTASGTGAASGFSADIDANESSSGDADPTNFRAFGGLQFNIPLVRFTMQVNKGLGNDLYGLNLGMKVLW